MCVRAQSQPTLLCPLDCSLPGSSVRGIFQTRTLEWVATSYFRSSPPRDQTRVSCISGLAGRFFTMVPPGKPVCILSSANASSKYNTFNLPIHQFNYDISEIFNIIKYLYITLGSLNFISQVIGSYQYVLRRRAIWSNLFSTKIPLIAEWRLNWQKLTLNKEECNRRMLQCYSEKYLAKGNIGGGGNK